MNRVFVSIGPITIYWYSIMVLMGILAGILMASIEAKKVREKEYIDDLIFYLILFGVLGARLYYVIFSFKNYKDDFLSIFKVWEGGLAIYGAVIAGLIVIIYYARKKYKSITKTADILAPSLILGQAIGRWGNFFNKEAHGGIVTYEFLKKLHIPKFIIKGMYIDGNYYHPTFLYESLWCLLGFAILLIIRKLTNRKKGMVIYSYFIWYGIGRFFIESLRTDSLYLGTIKVSQLVSAMLIMIGIMGIIINIRKEVKK